MVMMLITRSTTPVIRISSDKDGSSIDELLPTDLTFKGSQYYFVSTVAPYFDEKVEDRKFVGLWVPRFTQLETAIMT